VRRSSRKPFETSGSGRRKSDTRLRQKRDDIARDTSQQCRSERHYMTSENRTYTCGGVEMKRQLASGSMLFN